MKLNMFRVTHPHHQEPKTALAASGFCICKRLLDVCLLDADSFQQTHVQQPFTYAKTRGCKCSFGLLMMDNVSPKTCTALCKYGIINFDTLLHFVRFFCINCTMIHGSTNIKKHVFSFFNF
jgi:hypothetical protein